MKTKNLLLVLSLLFSINLFAEYVPIEKAKKVALNFYFEKHMQYEGAVSFTALQISSTFTKKQELETYYYVFSFNNGGFVIVPADNCLPPVLGYSFKHEFVAENLPPNVHWWFQQFEEQAIFVRDNNLKPKNDITEKWAHYQTNDIDRLYITEQGNEVEPLLTTLWNQGWPYNIYCPSNSVTGCVATAITQVLYYWRWPDHGRGYTSYIPELHPEYGVQSADFENTWYRWDEMVDSPVTANTAIAEFSYHMGVNLHMDYDPSGSGPSINLEEDSTAYHFKYLPYSWLYRDSMPDNEWKAILVNNLDNARPIFYAGDPENPPGHAFVCDGYQDEDYFHFNLGWGGSSNGYYTIDNVVGFNYNQLMSSITYPDTIQFNYPLFASGADSCFSTEGSITDGSGPVKDYLNNTQASWLIHPQNEMDSVTNITLSIKRCEIGEGDFLRIYDGADNTATLLLELSSNTIPEPIESTGNQLFVEFTTDSEGTAPGFYLDYHTQVPEFCSGQDVISDSIKRFDDGSGRFYYQNNNVCMWILQPEGCDSSLTLYFDYFDTEAEHDYLQILDFETQEELAKYSGYYEEAPPPVISPNGSILLLFYTNGNTRGQGWSAYYGVFTGIGDNAEPNGLNLYPNPARQTLNISFSTSEPKTASLIIFNQMGQKLKAIKLGNATLGNNEIAVDISMLENGIYFLQLQVDKNLITKKFVKQ